MHLGDYIYENGGTDNMGTQARRRRIDDCRGLSEPLRPISQRSCSSSRSRRLFRSSSCGTITRSTTITRDFIQDSWSAAGSSSRCDAQPGTRPTTSTCRCAGLSAPGGAFLQLYRPFSYLGFSPASSMLDTRQYRTDQPCGDGTSSCLARAPGLIRARLTATAQERWLTERLQRSRRWMEPDGSTGSCCVGSTGWPGPERRYSMDKWDGYQASFSHSYYHFSATRKPFQSHSARGRCSQHWVNDLRMNEDDPRKPLSSQPSSSERRSPQGGDGSEMSQLMQAMASENECVKFCNDQRGYVRFELKPSELRADFRVVDYVPLPWCFHQDTRLFRRRRRPTRSEARLEQRLRQFGPTRHRAGRVRPVCPARRYQ